MNVFPQAHDEVRGADTDHVLGSAFGTSNGVAIIHTSIDTIGV